MMENSDYISFLPMPSKFSLLQAKQSQLSNMVLRRKRQAEKDRDRDRGGGQLLGEAFTVPGSAVLLSKAGSLIQLTRSLRPWGHSERG